MDEMNRDLAYRLLGAFLLGCGLVGLCFEFQKWRQEMGVTALILVSIAYGLIFFFIIFGPARLRLTRAVRDLLLASLWGLCLMCGLLTGKHGLDRGKFGIRVKSGHRGIGWSARARLVISPTIPRLARPAIFF